MKALNIFLALSIALTPLTQAYAQGESASYYFRTKGLLQIDPPLPPDGGGGQQTQGPDIADQPAVVLGKAGQTIVPWSPVVPATWSGIVVDKGSRQVVSGYTLTPSVDLSLYGLSFNSATGQISGTPSTAFAIASFTITASLAGKTDVTAPFSLTVSPADPVNPGDPVTLAMAADQQTDYRMRVGTSVITQPIRVPNAVGAVTFAPPTNLNDYSWSATDGVMYGTATPEGLTSFYGDMTDSDGNTGRWNINLYKIGNVLAGPDLSASLIGTISYSGTQLVKAPTPSNLIGSASWQVSGLPDGLSYDPISGVMTGTVSDSSFQGVNPVALAISDSHDASSDTAILNVDVTPPMYSLPYTGAEITAGRPMAVGGFNIRTPSNSAYTDYPLSWQMTAGSLPSGVTTSSAGELLLFSGTPMSEGIYSSTWRVTDSRGWTLDLPSITFRVLPEKTLSITPINSREAAADVVYDVDTPVALARAVNLEGSAQWSATGLPDGLSIDADGNVVGTVTNPSQIGPNLVTLTLVDSFDNATATSSFTINVTSPMRDNNFMSVSLQAKTPEDERAFIIYTRTESVPYLNYALTWIKVSGDVPPGITPTFIQNRMQLVGTPTVPGTYVSSWKVRDSRGWERDLGSMTILVQPAPPVDILPLADLSIFGEQNYSVALPALAPNLRDASGSVVWSASGLPAGLTIDTATGLVTGRVISGAEQGDHLVEITALDTSDNSTDTENVTITVVAPFYNSSLTPFTGASLSQFSAMTTANLDIRGLGNVAYSGKGLTAELVSGSLPDGIVTSFAGHVFRFSGTPEEVGTFTSEWKLTDVDGWNITLPPITFTVAPRASVAISNLSALTVAGEQVYTSAAPARTMAATNVFGSVSWSASGLPDGLSINPSTGAITGSVTSGSNQGSFTASLTATDSRDGASVTSSLSIEVEPPFYYSLSSVYSGATVNQYNAIATSGFDIRGGGDVAYTGKGLTATLVSGVLPAGIDTSFSGQLFRFSGTPSASGNFTSQWRLTDGNGWRIDLPSVTFVVNPRATVAINNASALSVTGETVYSTSTPARTMVATNVIGTVTWTASGLPTGLAINSSTGAITGSVTNGALQGSHTATITATDSFDGASGSTSLTVNVNAPFTTLNYSGGTITRSVAMSSQGFNVRGAGNVPYRNKGLTASLVSGALPTGVAFSIQAGSELVLFSGTPTANVGTYSSIWRITDQNGWFVTPAEITFNVQAAPVLQVTNVADTSIIGTAAYTTGSPVRSFGSTGRVGAASFTATDLPAGLSINATSGVVTGTVTNSALQGTHFVTVTVRDTANNFTSSSVWKLTILPPFTLFNYTGGTGKVGTSITPQGFNFRTIGGDPYTNKGQKGIRTSGTFPPGLNVTNPVGTEFVTFSGTPTQAGTFVSVWRLEDANGWYIADRTVTITINP